MRNNSRIIASFTFLSGMMISMSGCDNSPIPQERYQKSDSMIQLISKNVSVDPALTEEIKIDHSRLAGKAGKPFAPTQVIMFNNESLEAKMVHKDQILALELPLKVLVYEAKPDQRNNIIWNDISYISNRYNTTFSDDMVDQYNQSIQSAIQGIPEANVVHFSTNVMADSGIITLDSQYSFDDTYIKALKVIKSNDDVVVFDEIDFKNRAQAQGVSIDNTKLIMFGAPKPGGESMADAQTLGLDAFPQKFLVWQDMKGVHVSYNKLTVMADRQNAEKSIALRVIQYRLNSSFEDAFH